MNIDNLKKLADFVEQNVTQEMFDMAQYRNGGANRNLTCVDITDNKNCGTVGCLLGWSPYVGAELSPKRYDEGEDGFFQWGKYCERVFKVETHEPEWDFLFGGEWQGIDNTVSSAVRRIRYLCENPEEGMIEITKIDYGEDSDSCTSIPENFPMPDGCISV